MDFVAFWFRRDLRLEDNIGLYHAAFSGKSVLPVFIFDDQILDGLSKNDSRITFIYDTLLQIHDDLQKSGSSICIKIGDPLIVWKELIDEYSIHTVYVNEGYEPYARQRDLEVEQFLLSRGVNWKSFKDQVIFGPTEVLKTSDSKPYTVYTPYKNLWRKRFENYDASVLPLMNREAFHKQTLTFPSLSSIGFVRSTIIVRPYDLTFLYQYEGSRNFPAQNATSFLSVHLRFGTVSIRQVISMLKPADEVFLNELIWREFFMQILYHFPHVISENFRIKYDKVSWRNDELEFEKWTTGQTGYALVDAGMHQLNQTGYMHNRIRMVVAGFLCKHLLIDWRWGEAYFAKKLLDYDLSSNNGNWQWAAGTGCDAAPYFRIFNPAEQQKKFDKEYKYVKRWIPNFEHDQYIPQIVPHDFARQRALTAYKKVNQS